jgi:membrane protein YqaA with SNARE-associated domain
MTALGDLGLGWTGAGCFAVAVVSAVVPWVNAEVLVLSLPALAPSRPALAMLVGVATAGQMTGKVAIYWAGRGSANMPAPHIARAIERWRPWFAASGRKAAGLIVLSSAIGVPPFFVTTLLAGAMRMPLATFVAAGTCGRLIRFGVLVFVPGAVMQARAWWTAAAP